MRRLAIVAIVILSATRLAAQGALPLPSDLPKAEMDKRWSLLTPEEKGRLAAIRKSLVASGTTKISCQDFLFVYDGDGWPFANHELRGASRNLGKLIEFVRVRLKLSEKESLEMRRAYDLSKVLEQRGDRPIDSMNSQLIELSRVLDLETTDGVTASTERKNVPKQFQTEFARIAVIAHVISTGDRPLTDDEVKFARDIPLLRDRVAAYVMRRR